MSTKRTILTVGIIAGLTAIGFGIAKIIKEQKRLLLSYCWKIKNVSIKKFTKDEIDLVLELLLRNQSDIDLDIYKWNLDVFIEGRKVANIDQPSNSGIEWKARAVSTIGLYVRFMPAKVFGSANYVVSLIAKFFTNKNNIKIGIKGTVSAKHSIFNVENLEIDMTLTIKDILSKDQSLEKCTINE